MMLRLRIILHCAYTVTLGCCNCLCWLETTIPVGGWVAGWVAGWVGGWVAGWVAGWVGGWVGGWLDQMGIRLISVQLKLELD